MKRLQRRRLEERFFKVLMRVMFGTMGLLALIILTVVRKGLSALSWSMLTEVSTGGSYLGQSEGGILNAILGSIYLAAGGTGLALLIGLPVALYLHTYATRFRSGGAAGL